MDGVRVVRRRGRRGDQDIIHIDNDASSLREEAELDVLEDLIHHGLECTRGICQPEEHDTWFKKTVFGLKCCFLFIPCLDPNVVVSPSYVELGEDVRVLHLTDEIGNERQGVSISDGELV